MIGVDEVGRGAWAGPLLVCAVRLNSPVSGLKDSKLLSKNKREKLAVEIKKAADVGYGWLSPADIDKHGLGKALELATLAAVEEIIVDVREEIIIDGLVNLAPGYNVKTVIKADRLVHCVSAASIVAKVARDTHMCLLAKQFPQYGFDKHVGYGTKVHADALKTHGVSIHHRLSFKPCRMMVVE
jgi:ribonuclease HII